MENRNLGEMEEKFALLLWRHAPATTRRVTELAAEAFDWKRTTTYTMLKRLCERGLFEMQDKTVKVLVTEEEYRAGCGEQVIDSYFGGSLPRFLAAFTQRKKLSRKEIDEIEALIASYREEE